MNHAAFLTASLLSLLTLTATAHADKISVPGTGDGIEILRALASAYSNDPSRAGAQTLVDIPPSIGSGGGVAAVADGRAVIGRVARPLTPSEAGAGIIAVPVMRIPAVIFAHPAAGVKELSFAQLAGIYAGDITNWREIGGADLRIRVVRRESEDSTLKVLRATMPGWQPLVITPHSKVAVTTQEAVESVKETEGAIGFGPNSATLNRDLTVMKLEGMEPLAAAYPSVVTVSLIYRQNALPAEAEGFLKFAASAPAQAVISGLGASPWIN